MLESFPKWFVMNRPIYCRSIVLVSIAGFMKLNYSKTLKCYISLREMLLGLGSGSKW
jgi:hypothetical protein